MPEGVYDEVEANGYAFLRGHLAKDVGSAAFRELGPIANLPGLRPIQEITPKSQVESTPNTYSGQYGYGRFPLHTDLAHWLMPPRYLVLRCRVGFDEVTTDLVDGRCLEQAIGKEILFRALVRSRRPVRGKIRRMRLLSKVTNHSVLRWDNAYLRPLCAAGQEGISAMRLTIPSTPPIPVALRDPGDTLVIDNWRMLHGRSHLGTGHASRVLERAYLEALN
jgi:hypothetical protein